MGITISRTELSPFSTVTGIIGLVSFAFTVGTFLRVVWVNFETMTQAQHEVHSYLTNLRTELLEEKANIKVMRRLCKKNNRAIRRGAGGSLYGLELDDVSLKTMGDTVRTLMRKFKELEDPFLVPGENGIDGGPRRSSKRSRSTSPYYQHSAYALPEKGRGRSRADSDGGRREQDDDDAFWAQRTQYASFNFKRRLAWLTRKADTQQLFETLTRVQVRRTARQVAGMTLLMHEFGASTLQQEDMLRRINDRMGNIVGLRRV